MKHRPGALDTTGLAVHHAAFAAACRAPEQTRDRLLAALVRENQHTAFGREHGFATCHDAATWRQRVPIRDYDEHLPWLRRVAQGEAEVLTAEPVKLLVPTSGSSGGRKLIPFTAGLARAIERAVGAWLADLAQQTPAALAGPAYWAISPPLLATDEVAGPIPVALPDDLDYFDPAMAGALARWLLPVPAADDGATFMRRTAECLLAQRDLAMVSVWSPSFLLLLDEALVAVSGRPGVTWRERWPSLALVSCWTHGEAARWLPAVRARLGGVPLQGKGLMATEGVTSIPVGTGEPALALHAHLVELRQGEAVYWPTEAQLGGEYEVILSTQGGLYRYATGDRVRVTGWVAPGVPRLAFLGRGPAWSDRVGEKLASEFVASVLAELPATTWGILVAGDRHYTLLLGATPEQATAALGGVEAGLRRNPYYAQARDTGQLGPLARRRLPPEALVTVLGRLAARQGCRLGDYKLPALLTDTAVLAELEDLTCP